LPLLKTACEDSLSRVVRLLIFSHRTAPESLPHRLSVKNARKPRLHDVSLSAVQTGIFEVGFRE